MLQQELESFAIHARACARHALQACQSGPGSHAISSPAQTLA